jgi:hypothetical protein
MGHTVLSQRIMVDIIINELRAYGKALREEDRIVYENMLRAPLKKIGAISYASSINVWAFILLSILLEQEKRYVADGRVSEREQDSPLD